LGFGVWGLEHKDCDLGSGIRCLVIEV